MKFCYYMSLPFLNNPKDLDPSKFVGLFWNGKKFVLYWSNMLHLQVFGNVYEEKQIFWLPVCWLGQWSPSTRMVVQGQLVEPAICFNDQQACKELIHSFISQKPNNIILRQQIFFLIFMNQKLQFLIFLLANDYFIVGPSSVTLTFNYLNKRFKWTIVPNYFAIHA